MKFAICNFDLEREAAAICNKSIALLQITKKIFPFLLLIGTIRIETQF